MSKNDARSSSLVLAALLAGALALPGVAAADGDRGRGGDPRGDWHGQRHYDRDEGYRGERHYEGGYRDGPHHHDRARWHRHDYRDEREVVERPAYRPPAPPLRSGVSVFLNSAW